VARILHLLTRAEDDLAAEIMARQKAGGHEVEAIDLTGAEPGYEDVVKKIFQADSVQTW